MPAQGPEAEREPYEEEPCETLLKFYETSHERLAQFAENVPPRPGAFVAPPT